MNKHLSALMAAALAAAMLFPSPALADHRPGNVVVMGGTLSLTGPYDERSRRIHNGRKLYVDELNARGGLLGHKIELKIYDDKSDRRTAVELYEKLITEDKVDLVFGPYGSFLNDAAANVMERYKQPFIGSGSKPTIWQRGRKYIFKWPGLPARDRFKGVLQAAKKIGVKRIAIITRSGATSLHVFVGIQEWAKKLGLEVVLAERFHKMRTDFRALLQKIEASGAQAIVSQARFPAAVAQLRQLHELNINVKMFAVYGGLASQPRFVKQLGGLAEYVVGHSTWEPRPALGHPGIAEFIANYEKRYGMKPNYHASEGYAAMQITETAVKRAGSLDPEKLRDVLASIAVYTIRGLYRGNEQGLSPSVEPLAFQIQNGKRVIVWPEYAAEAEIVPMPRWEDRAKK